MYSTPLTIPTQPVTPQVTDVREAPASADAIRVTRDPMNRQQVVVMLGTGYGQGPDATGAFTWAQLGYCERDFMGWLAYANLEPCGGFARADLKEFGFSLRDAVEHVITNGTPL